MPLIALLTDFGLRDTYVAQMHAAIFSICPEARVIDLTHAIEPQQIAQGAYTLWSVLDHLPPGTIIVAVVDPGVGSDRPILALSAAHGALRFIGPDNGLFGFLRDDFPGRPKTLTTARIAFGADLVAVRASNSKYFGPARSSTFHGRDIMSPMAAHLARGADFFDLGPRVTDAPMPCAGLWPEFATRADGTTYWRGAVLHVDRFGNAMTNVPASLLPTNARFRVAWGKDNVALIGPATTFADVPANHPLTYIGSSGFVEIAINRGHAVQKFGLRIGHPIGVELVPADAPGDSIR